MDVFTNGAAQAPRIEPIASVRGAHAGYGDRAVLRGLSLDLNPGEILVLLGPNGAGKSTLVKALSGQLRPSIGTVRVVGRDPSTDRHARRVTGIVPQQIALFERLTVKENLLAFGHLMGVPRRAVRASAVETIALIGLTDRAKDQISHLSGGMRRRVNIGAALMHGPKLLILDEPTVGVDFRARNALAQLLKSLRDKGMAILLTTHDMEEAEALADRVAIIVAGEIKAQGYPRSLVHRVFGARKHMRVAFPASAQFDQQTMAYGHALAAAGLITNQEGTVWTGMVAPTEPQIRALIDQLVTGRSGAIDVAIREPGLDTLLGAFLDQGSGHTRAASAAEAVAS